MGSIWVESLGRSLEQSLDMLAAAVDGCPEERWATPMWAVSNPSPGLQFLRADWTPVTEPDEHNALARRWVERRSTPWSVAWHALEGLDYDLNGEFGPWAPPPPFTGHPHWRDLASLPGAWPRSALLAYVEECRRRVRTALEGMTDERAATPLPPAHRYGGQPHAWVISGLVVHTTEHASQIRQFITGARTPPTRNAPGSRA